MRRVPFLLLIIATFASCSDAATDPPMDLEPQRVLLVNNPPFADAGGPYDAVPEGSPLALYGAGSFDPDVDPIQYSWSTAIPGGVFDNPTSPNPSVTFPDDGTGDVCLMVTDNGGLTDTDCTEITVLNVAPTCGAINGPAGPVDVNVMIHFTSMFTDPGTLDTHSAEWDWNYLSADTDVGTVDQGGGSGWVRDFHAYTAAGTYQVQLTVTDDDGGVCEVQSELFDVLANDPPFADPGLYDDIPEGSPLALNGEGSYDPDGDPIQYSWSTTIPGGTFDDPTNPTTSVTFPDNDTGDVCLTVTDDGGLSDTNCTEVTVMNVAPTCGAISGPTAPVDVNVMIYFTSMFTDPGTLDTHTAVWDWDYPNADTDVGTVDQGGGSGWVRDYHAYTTGGTYQVQLLVTDDDGGVCEVRSDVPVVVYIPVAVDIKPGSDPNCINVRKKGVTPVAILATADFDPTTVDPATVTLGPGVPNDVSPLRWSWNKDVNGDGTNDLVLHFSTPEVAANGLLTEGGTVILKGQTKEEYGGQLIKGMDIIHLAGGPVCRD